MSSNVQRKAMPSGKLRDHLIPTARVESSGVAKENRRSSAAPFPESDFNSVDGNFTVEGHSFSLAAIIRHRPVFTVTLPDGRGSERGPMLLALRNRTVKGPFFRRRRVQNLPHRPPPVIRSIVPKRLLGVIPARFASSRFPGKALTLIAGKPMLQHVYERASQARYLTKVIIATDDERIHDAARGFRRASSDDARRSSLGHRSRGRSRLRPTTPR